MSKTNLRFAGTEDVPAVKRLNNRLLAGGRPEQVTLRFSLPGEARFRPEGFPVYRRLLVAEDEGEIHAALLLYHNNVFIRGDKQDFCWLDMPVSEGIVNRKHSLEILKLMKKAINYQPFLMSLGIGSLDEEASRLFIKLGWKHGVVPFLFYPLKLNRVLRGLHYLENRPMLRFGARLAAYTGAGALAGAIMRLKLRTRLALSGYEVTVEPRFGDWADDVFHDAMQDYAVAIRSDATSLNIIYPPDDPQYVRLRVSKAATKKDAGWIVVRRSRMENNQYFGNLTIGTLVDGFGRVADVPLLLAAGLKYLTTTDVDLALGNFSHKAWVTAATKLGMFSGPSNFYVFVSPHGSPLLTKGSLDEIHLTRGQGGGMVHLR